MNIYIYMIDKTDDQIIIIRPTEKKHDTVGNEI